MTPYAAVARVSHALHALTGSGAHLSVCPACRAALLDELAGMFPPVEEPQAVDLAQSCLLGCTFSIGTPEQCALHRLIYEDSSVCP